MNVKLSSVRGLALVAVIGSSPVMAIGLGGQGPSSPAQTFSVPASGSTLAGISAGSGAIIPLVTADAPDNDVDGGFAIQTPTEDSTNEPLDDLSFVARATQTGRHDVLSAREALPQLKDPELKRVAESLAGDRATDNARLSRLAEEKMWPLPAAQRPASPPSGTSSHDFDATWTAQMIASQERSEALYSAQAHAAEDQDVREYARTTLPTIQRHLAELRRLQK